jgi:hypothetical protein
MFMHADDAGDYGLASGVNYFRAGGYGKFCGCTDCRDFPAVDYYGLIGLRRGSGAVNHLHVRQCYKRSVFADEVRRGSRLLRRDATGAKTQPNANTDCHDETLPHSNSPHANLGMIPASRIKPRELYTASRVCPQGFVLGCATNFTKAEAAINFDG